MNEQSPSLLVSDQVTHFKLDYLAKRIDKVSRTCKKLEKLTFVGSELVLGELLLAQTVPIPVPVPPPVSDGSSADLSDWEALPDL